MSRVLHFVYDSPDPFTTRLGTTVYCFSRCALGEFELLSVLEPLPTSANNAVADSAMIDSRMSQSDKKEERQRVRER